MTLLEARSVTVSYGGLHANESIDLDCHAGKVVGLIGPNGAGKTTFIDALTGFTPLSEGRVLFDGVDLAGKSPHQRTRMGLTRTFQSLELFEDLNVRENLMVAAERPRWYSLLADAVAPRRHEQRQLEAVEGALHAMQLEPLATAMPNDLSHGQRKLVSVARALAARPRLLLLDEPAAGLDTTESQLLGTRLRSCVTDEMGMFLIDHDMGLVLGVCDYLYVLDFGRIIAHGTPAEVRSNPDVIAAYLGTSGVAPAPGESAPVESAPEALG